MKCKLLNQLRNSEMVLLLTFDQMLKNPPYIRRPIRLWFDTPKGRIQMTVGGCLDVSYAVDSQTVMALYDIKLMQDAYERPNDFVDKLMKSFEVTSNTEIHDLLSMLGISEIQLMAFEDEEETRPLYPSSIWSSINGKYIPITSEFKITPSAPKCG